MSTTDGIFKWYVAEGKEPEVYQETCDTFEEALAIGKRDYSKWGFTIVEADKALPTCDVFDADQIIERYEELNEDCWGEDGAEISPTSAQQRELEMRLSLVLKEWMTEHDLSGRAWSFGETRFEQFYPGQDVEAA